MDSESESKVEVWRYASLPTLVAAIVAALLFAAHWEANRYAQARMDVFHGDTVDLARISESTIAHRMRQYDDSLLTLRAAFVADPKRFAEHVELLRSGPLADREVLVVLVDNRGRLAYTDAPNVKPGLSLAERAYFRYFADGGEDRLYVDEPTFGRVTKRYTLPLARPIYDSHGGFLGVVAISVKQDALTEFGANLKFVGDAMVTLFNRSGAVVSRSREPNKYRGVKLAADRLAVLLADNEGAYSAPSALDGVERYIAFRHVDGAPLIVAVAASPKEVRREVAEQRMLLMASAAFSSVVILALLGVYLQRRKVMVLYLATQRRYLREAQRIAGMGSWEFDLATHRFQWSDEVFRLFGVTRAAFAPTLDNVRAFVPATEHATLTAAFEQILMEGRGKVEYVIVRRDGELRQMLARAETTRHANGKVVALIGTVRDVTEARAAERALAQSEAQFRTLAQVVPVGIFHADAEGLCSYINERFCEISGRTSAATLQFSWMNIVHAEDRERIEAAWRQARSDGASFAAELRIVRPDGGIRWALVQAQVESDAHGASPRWVGSITDISDYRKTQAALRESHAEYAGILATTLDGFWRVDAQGCLLDVNASYERQSGYTQVELLGMKVGDLEADESAAEIADHMRRVIEVGGDLFESRHRRKDGSIWPVEISVSYRGDGGGLFFVFIRDIAARKRVEAALQRNVVELGMRYREISCLNEIAEISTHRESSVEQMLDACVRRIPNAWIDPAHVCARIRFGERLFVSPGFRACARTLAVAMPSLHDANGLIEIGYHDDKARNDPTPFLDEERALLGSIARQLGQALDRRWADEQLRRSELRLRDLLNRLPIGLGLVDERGVIAFRNRRFIELFGYTEADAPTIDEWRRYAYPDEAYRRSVLGLWQAAVQKAMELDVNIEPHEYRIVCKDGTTRIVEISGIVTGADCLATFIDLTERRRVSDELHKARALLDATGHIAHIGGWALEVDTQVVTWSTEIYHIHELEAERPPDFDVALDFYPAEARAILTDKLQACIETGQSVDIELPFVTAKGRRLWVNVQAQAERESGRTVRLVGACQDISERKRIETELEEHKIHLEELVEKRTLDLAQALDAAQLADRAKDAFLANVSHELRTPLNAVIGLSSLAQRLSADPKLSDYLSKIEDAGKTLSSLINDLLDLSKIAAGHMELDPVTFSLRRFLARSRSMMSFKITEKGLQFVERIAEDVPDVLVGDSLRLEQIVLNLLSNAVKFTAAGRIELRIGVAAREANRLCLALEVEDTGVGMREEDIARLFVPFAQVDASVSRKFGGTGLGLALCKRLAELMGGDIGVASTEGQGSTFRVSFWLEQGDAVNLPVDDHGGDKQAPPVRYRNACVLVVDDQPMNREIVGELLMTVGITPRMAVNGREALEILAQTGAQDFDLVLMDIQMPVLDGLSATRELRRRPEFADLPIVAMTAHTMEHEKQLSMAAGMNDHIGKPFETETFYRLLAKWISPDKQQVVLESTVCAAPDGSDLPAMGGIDTHAGLARFAGNVERYRHWLLEFVAEAPNYSLGIRSALASRNHDQARKTAHAIKGRVGMLGMQALYSVADALEKAVRDDDATGDLLDALHLHSIELAGEIEAAIGEAEVRADEAISHVDNAPTDPLPQALQHLIALLDAGDGGSASAIAACLKDFMHTSWEARLQSALAQARRFDFVAARQRLTGSQE